ncbi:MAG: DegT/DnrJ/EryC1/StrS family aminotransferase [Phycisphaerales bacterium JB043]
MTASKHERSTPAILGGQPCVTAPLPHHVWPSLGEDEERAVLDLVRRGAISLHRRGDIIEAFEDAFAEAHDARYSLSTHSGTGAIHAGYFALGLAPGDEVIAPAYTHLGTILPMLHVGVVPVLCDIDETNGNIDPDEIETHITDRTRAIAVTHQYGHACDMDRVIDIASRHGLQILEDCSHAHGASYKGRPVGTLGDVGCFSLQSHKAVPAGEGGMLVTDRADIIERAALLGHFRQQSAWTSNASMAFVETGYGLKSRLHPLAAAIGLEQLKKLAKVNELRAMHHTRLCEAIQDSPGVEPLRRVEGARLGGYFRFVIRVDGRSLNGLTADLFLRSLVAEGATQAMSGSLAKPMHLTRIMQTLDDGMYRGGWPRRGDHVGRVRVYQPGDFPKAERFSASTIQLPAFTYEHSEIVDQYASAIRRTASCAEAILTALSAGGPA